MLMLGCKELNHEIRFNAPSTTLGIIIHIIFFSFRERAVFYKSCNLIGSESGQYSPHPARSQRAVSDPFKEMFRSFLGSLLNHLLISLRK